jgi:precorrin-8X/cobalt-precorrin-8 methylmutase
MTLFDAYLMVDWCASARRKTGRDSVWYYLLSRTSPGSTLSQCSNPATRIKAIEEIAKILADCSEWRIPTLIGFDFPYGDPSGFANALGLSDKSAWRAVWDAIAVRIEDHEDNSNNRFEASVE